ncbi:MAG: 1,4-dihydroxy-2-naphthoate polyprenyltransferase [Caldilineaceae bacterium]|nr:1,4-dihydroxy-2-naphthoate polyprenyltransferase [Caldilineaceae bacterium]
MTTRQISKFQAWIMAARPKTLPAAVGPVVTGAALALHDGAFRPLPALAAAAGALLLQILSNFANDYSDFFRGADTEARQGPTRVTATGLMTPRELRMGIGVVIGLAVLVGVYLIIVGGWPILAVGAASILAALLYTGGPRPYGYYGLGDFFVFLFFGLAAVCGTYYVQALTLTWPVVLAAVPVGALVTAILVVNNYRDRHTDAAAHKRTLAVILGRRGAQMEYAGLLLVAYAMPLVIWLTTDHSAWVLLTWLTLPLGVNLMRQILTLDGKALNQTLAGTARLSMIFGLLLAVGLIP